MSSRGFNHRGKYTNSRGRDKGKSGRGNDRDRSRSMRRDESEPVNQAFLGNYDQEVAGPSLLFRYLIHL